MTWLKNGFACSHLAWLFKISKSTFTRYLITWTNCCYFFLGAIPIWPSREAIDSTMPQSFKNTYPSTRCIIDFTELFCQRPSSLSTQSCMHSHYKNHVTYKGLLGIAPSGGITFISQQFISAGCMGCGRNPRRMLRPFFRMLSALLKVHSQV